MWGKIVSGVAVVAVASGAMLAWHERGRIEGWLPKSPTEAVAKVADVHETVEGTVAVPADQNGSLVLYVHGSGQRGIDAFSDAETSTVTARLLQDGYVVAAADAHGDAWGNPASVEDYEQLVTTVRARYDLSKTYILAESMGGLAGAELAASSSVSAWAAFYPVCNIDSLNDPELQRQIGAAYPHGAPAKTPWPRKPVAVWASPADTVVPAAQNAYPCASAVDGVIHQTTGDHGDASNFDPEAVAHFFDNN